MSGIGAWILGVVMGLLALIGLVMASQAHDAVFYWTGLLVFVFGVSFIFVLIGRSFDRASSE
ncbi:MAG: hypothetical protein MI920_22700 [Kiloniellales bacterium]|nr:hypothetical protein [Kiloniellales bacterium]